MKRAAFGLLCVLALVPAAAFAQQRGSITSITPASFYSFQFEQSATITGVDLFGDIYGAPDSENIFLSTHLVVDGPAGTFNEDISGGFRALNTLNDTIFVSIPDASLFVEGRYSVTIVATDDTGQRLIGPVYYNVVTRVIAQPPLLSVPENVVGEADSPTGGHVTFSVSGFSFVDPAPAPTIVCNHNSGDFFPLGATSVNCTATDSFGSAFGSFEVFVQDSQPPVITVPANFSSNTSLVTYSVSATDAVDGTRPVSCSPASGSLFPNGPITVNCSSEDLHANVSFAQFVVTVSDPGQPPALTVPDDFFFEATGPAGAAVTYSVTATGNATVTCSPASGSIFGVGVNPVSCSATSPGGTTTAGFNIIVIDTVGPVITVPSTITANATSPSGAVVTYFVSAIDAISGGAAVTCDPPSGSTFPIGTTMVRCTAQDASFNFGSASFFVIISEDSTPPVLSLPANITAEATGPNGAVVTYTATANDDHDGPVPVTCFPASGSTFALGVTTVQCSAMDSHNNVGFGSFTITVRDTTPPALSLPANITTEATSPNGATASYTATANDVVDGSVPVTCDHASGSTFPLGFTTVQCTASDSHSNVAHGSFTVNVRDTTPPALSLPADITIEATGPSGAAVTYSATATDIVDGSVPVTCDHASGSTFPLGFTTVQCTATDSHSNVGHGSFNVNVRDTTPPALSLPADITAEATGPNGADVTYSATATDIVDGSRPVTCDHASGSTFPLGTTTVQCTATDTHNNTAHGSFTVTVRDTTPPTIVSITASPSNLWPPNHKMANVTVTVIATDLVDPAPTSHIVSVSSNQGDNGNGDGNTPTDWVITGPLTLQLRAERDGSADRIYTITIATTDFSGNTAQDVVTVSVSQTSNSAAASPVPSPGRGRAVRP